MSEPKKKLDPVAEEAARRAAWHRARPHGTPSLRPNGEDGNHMGLRVEEELAERFRGFAKEVDLEHRPCGDGGKDNELILRVTVNVEIIYPVDCKGAIHPKDLIVEEGKCRPNTIYVLGQYHPKTDKATLIGWQWGSVLLKVTPRSYGHGKMNHWWPSATLRKFHELDARLVAP